MSFPRTPFATCLPLDWWHIDCFPKHPKAFLSSRVFKRTFFSKCLVFLMFLDRLFTPRVLGRFAKCLFTHQELSRATQKLNKHSSRKIIFRMVLVHNMAPREGFWKAQWNVEWSIEHYKPWGRYTKSFIIRWMLLKTFENSRKLNIPKHHSRFFFMFSPNTPLVVGLQQDWWHINCSPKHPRAFLSSLVLQRTSISYYELVWNISSQFRCARCGGHCRWELLHIGEMQYCYFGIFFERLNHFLHVIDNK